MIIKIAYNKPKLLFYILIATVFVISGSWLISISNSLFEGFIKHLLFVLCCFSIVLLFAYIAFLNCYKLLKNNPGLIIGESGIIINLSITPPVFVNWKEIEEVFYAITSGQTFIMLRVKSPQLFIQKQKGWIRRFLMNINLKTHNAPIALSTSILNCKHESVYELICQTCGRHKTKSAK